MIYLTEGNTPLNEAYNDEIVQERNNTYQLTFRFPTSDPKWELLREETFLTADDLHGEQDFYIFEVEKQQGYIQVYANQVISLLNNYIVSSIDVDRVSGTRVLSAFAGSITRANPFSFFSDIDDRHTLNIKDKNAMEVLAKDKHSILGQWGGDMVRNGYNLRLLKNGGSENESLFMYKKNLSSYQHKTSTKSLKTRITFKTTVKGEGEKAPDVDYVVVIDSPLLGKYSQIYEAVVEVNDQNVKDQASLIEYGKQYFRTSMCDMLEDNLEISVVGQSDVAVRMFDVVSIYHEWYGLDVRKKITKYTYSPMAKRLKSIGFGTFQSSLANAIGGIVNDAVLNESQNLHKIFEERLKKEIANADRAFDAESKKRKKEIDDGIELAKAKAEEVKQELSDTINQRFNSFNNGPLQEVKRRAEEALRNAGASSLLAQEAKRIWLDSVAKLEAFKAQTTSAQTALSGDLDALKRTIANDIRPKQAQAEAEITKQVEALVQTKKELVGVKSAQSTYEETTTRRLSELTNLANGKASKSELTQTAEELTSKIASLQVGGRNLYVLSKNKDISRSSHLTDLKFDISSGEISFRATGLDPYFGEATIHPKSVSDRNGVRIPVILGKAIYVTVSNPIFIKNYISYFDKNGNTVRSYKYYKSSSFVISSKELEGANFITIRFGCGDSDFEVGSVIKTKIKVEYGTIPTDWSPAPEDIEGQISIVESNFRQRADALDAGVNRLTEGLRTKADISALNVTAENIRQSVKSLETNTQNKLDQKLSQAEFEVRAGSIRQEILNATKDKADKTLVVAEAGKLREEFSNLRVGGTNLLKGSKGPFLPDRKPANFDNAILYAGNTSIYMEQGQEYIISAKTDGTFTAHHDGNKESDNVVLWIMDKDVRNYQIVSDLKTGTTGTKITWNKPTGIYHLRVNTYHKEATKSVWDVKIEKGNVATDWSPAPEDTDGLITEAKAIFERTAQGLRTDLSAIQDYVNKDGQRQETLQRYAREESAKQVTAVRELVTRDYVGKATYQEDVKGINQRIEAVKTSANKEIASQIASYRQSVDGKFTDISSQITTYKQDVGGQISGLSNRLTSSEQGTTTQISNLSNRINSNKQGTDNQISNLKTQVATNKDNAERQMGRISDQVSANKANADSQFANVTNQLARKVETTDFQRVKETSQLYERILGNSENGIADKVARMAMTNQLFQVEVSKNEGLKTVQRQLAGSWAVQNINSAGDIISGINLGANGHNRFDGKLTHITGETLIDNAVIKSAMVDKLKTANFETGSVTTKILDAEAVTADKVRFDDAFIRKMIANEAFINQLTSKRIFATKVESVITSSTVLEGYKGWIGGFQLGTHDSGYGRWITGRNHFSVGMGNGEGGDGRTALWVNWGNNWSEPGYYAWFVKNNGKMYCYNTAEFWKTPIINGDLKVTGRIRYDGGVWIYSSQYEKIGRSSKDYFYLEKASGARDWFPAWNDTSDRRLKSNIQESDVSGIDIINRLKTYSYRKEFNNEVEDISCGIMAQDVQKYAPDAFREGPDGIYTYNTFALVPYLIKAIQELNQKIEKMEKTIA